MPVPLVIAWANKLTRVCRSSLWAEAQSGANGEDALELANICFTLSILPNPNDVETFKVMGELPFITDATVLRDADLSSLAGDGITEKKNIFGDHNEQAHARYHG